MERPLVPLVDGFGRVHTDLRVSVTDRCNLRCTYCMPEEGLAWLPRSEILTFEEIARLVSIGVHRLGIRKVRLTGGEPLVRRGLPELVAQIAAVAPDLDLSMTTNGVGLALLAQPLKDAGLRRINVSLDTLSAERFASITKRDRLDDVLAGLRAALDAGLSPVKINAVPLRGVNDDEIGDMAEFAIANGYRLRFIESMPLDAQGAWDRDAMITAEEILGHLRQRFDLTPLGHDDRAPAEEWRVAGHHASIGIIASVTRAFCSTCDRVRLTADGQLRNCLFATQESDLRTLLRDGSGDDAIEAAWRGSIARKGAGHLINSPEFQQPARPMSAIGG